MRTPYGDRDKSAANQRSDRDSGMAGFHAGRPDGENVMFRTFGLVDKSFVLDLRVVAEVYQDAQRRVRGLQIVDDLGAVFVSQGLYCFDFENDALKAEWRLLKPGLG
jgi:hypothetical protein